MAGLYGPLISFSLDVANSSAQAPGCVNLTSPFDDKAAKLLAAAGDLSLLEDNAFSLLADLGKIQGTFENVSSVLFASDDTLGPYTVMYVVNTKVK